MLNHYRVPDYSLELERMDIYLQFIHEHFSATKNRGDCGELILDDNVADTFGWMLCDMMKITIDLQKALYFENAKSERAK